MLLNIVYSLLFIDEFRMCFLVIEYLCKEFRKSDYVGISKFFKISLVYLEDFWWVGNLIILV